eukprot:2071184-Lingulodinium_polyedra.AAC.1
MDEWTQAQLGCLLQNFAGAVEQAVDGVDDAAMVFQKEARHFVTSLPKPGEVLAGLQGPAQTQRMLMDYESTVAIATSLGESLRPLLERKFELEDANLQFLHRILVDTPDCIGKNEEHKDFKKVVEAAVQEATLLSMGKILDFQNAAP